ncbi:MAG TPA: tape measure protein, partial [Bacteroidales bacterium]|nr:tape measure protein [Bacteroidales bacterium]
MPLGSLVVSLLGDTKQFERSMTVTQKKVMAMGKSLSDIGKKMTMFVTLPIVGIGTAALISAGKMEKHRIAFETMLRSADKAEGLLKDIEKFSAATPFQLPNLVEGTKRLIAFGTESKDVIDKMRMLGNAAQGDQEILDRLTLAYGKLQAKGRATLEELNMFTEAGVPILQALADTLEVTTEELFDMISQGKVSFDDVDKALRSLTTGSGQFAGMIEKQSKSLLGLFSTVKDNLGMLARSFAVILLPQIKNFLERTLAVVQKIGEMDDKTKKLILAVAGLAAGLGPVLFISGKLVGSITALSAALKLLIPKLITLGAAAGPIFLVAAALTALGLIIYKNVQANK